MVFSEASMPLRHRGAALRRQAVDGGQQRIPVVGRRLHGKTAVAETHHADLHAQRLALDEILGGSFGGFHAGWLEIGGRHAAGNVKGQDDRAFHPGQADHCLRVAPG